MIFLGIYRRQIRNGEIAAEQQAEYSVREVHWGQKQDSFDPWEKISNELSSFPWPAATARSPGTLLVSVLKSLLTLVWIPARLGVCF
jgi:hypothetical protein